MIQQIIGKIIAHKAGIILGGAAVGVAVTAIMASKDGRKHQTNLLSADAEKLTELDDDQLYEYEEIEDHHPGELLNKKEKASIFAKSYWRTGMAMAVTFGLMVLSHRAMVKELAATAAALGLMSSRYKELAETLKEKYPDTYEKITDIIDQKNARKEISEKPFLKEETYDGRYRYYIPQLKKVWFATEKEFMEAREVINEDLMNVGSANMYNFLAAFPKHCDIHIPIWCENYGWFQGASEITAYEDTSNHIGSFVKVTTKDTNVVIDGEKYAVKKIIFNHEPEIEPDTPYIVEHSVTAGLNFCKKKRIKEVA